MINYRSENKTIEEWIESLNNGNTLRFNVLLFNEFMEVFSFFNPTAKIEKEVDYNMITFKLKR